MYLKYLLSLMLSCSACSCLAMPSAIDKAIDVSQLQLSKSMMASQPLTIAQRRTTSGQIYLGNLNGIIRQHEFAYKQNQSNLTKLLALAELYRYRHSIVGHDRDLHAARDLLTQASKVDGTNIDLLLMQAETASSEHEFIQAQQILTRLANGSINLQQQKKRQRLQRDIGFSIGADVEADLVTQAKQTPSLANYTQLANLRVQQGKFAVADILFKQAQQQYHDVNPLPLAWLHTQHGIMFLRMQHYQLAKLYFAAAHRRFPQYYLATEHLAEAELLLGNHQQALALYQQVSLQTHNPQFHLGVAQAQTELNNPAAAQQAQELARLGFDEWLQQENWAQLQHSAEYFYQANKSGLSALLVNQNLTSRRNVDSLLLATKLSSGEQACAYWREAVATSMRPPEMLIMSKQPICL